jgi:K+-sensing histidine kinase KdpD
MPVVPANPDEQGAEAPAVPTAVSKPVPGAPPARRHSQRLARRLVGYLWSAAAVAAATTVFSLGGSYLDKTRASLLYLPIVIICAWLFGFGPAVLGAVLSFSAGTSFWFHRCLRLRLMIHETEFPSLYS